MLKAKVSPLEISAFGTHVYWSYDGKESDALDGKFFLGCPEYIQESKLVDGACSLCETQIFWRGK